jgi:hypothetical protein
VISNGHRQVAWAREESPAFMPVECQAHLQPEVVAHPSYQTAKAFLQDSLAKSFSSK